jgi:hypothetical protein
MYAKIFASLYQGTLRGNAHAILVFTNLLAHSDKNGFVDKHWRAISDEVGISVDEVKKAIEYLERPDPESRTPEEEGRRLVPMDEHRAWGWRIVNHAKYRAMRNEDDRTEQNRSAQERRRKKLKELNVDNRKSDDSQQNQPGSAERQRGQPMQRQRQRQRQRQEATSVNLQCAPPAQPAPPAPPATQPTPSAPTAGLVERFIAKAAAPKPVVNDGGPEFVDAKPTTIDKCIKDHLHRLRGSRDEKCAALREVCERRGIEQVYLVMRTLVPADGVWPNQLASYFQTKEEREQIEAKEYLNTHPAWADARRKDWHDIPEAQKNCPDIEKYVLNMSISALRLKKAEQQ